MKRKERYAPGWDSERRFVKVTPPKPKEKKSE